MLICRCEGVDRFEIVQAIARGARTVTEVGEACGAGRRCGTCRAAIRRLIEAAHSGPRFISALAVASVLGRAD